MNIPLYKKAIIKWGIESQLDMLQEEAAELIMSVNKYRRGKPWAKSNIAEEIADVEIMCAQIVHGLKLTKALARYKLLKLKRLERRLRK